MQTDSELRQGVLYALGAYGMWGLIPLYFSAIAAVSSTEVVAHRILWSVVLLLALLGLRRSWQPLRHLFGDTRAMARLGLCALVIAANWLVFIWAVGQGRVLETSLGYFINPLVSVFLGMLFLGERLRPAQWLAVALAGLAVAYQLVLLGSLPWVALVLALCFGTYGLLRKQVQVGPVLGLFVETLLLLPLAALYLLWLFWQGELQFLQGPLQTDLLLVASGLVTTLPLLCFAAAAQRLSLTLTGMLQYLAPSISFALAVFHFGEPMDGARLFTFVLIWSALLVFTLEGWQSQRRRRRLQPG